MSPLRKVEYQEEVKLNKSYTQNPIESQVIEGYFQKEISQRALAIRRVNKTLCCFLGVMVLVAFISYYFAMTNELTLNKLSRQITALNDENAELQNHLDRLKSFNNVDSKMMQFSALTKAENVIEVSAVSSVAPVDSANQKTASFNWAIGY